MNLFSGPFIYLAINILGKETEITKITFSNSVRQLFIVYYDESGMKAVWKPYEFHKTKQNKTRQNKNSQIILHVAYVMLIYG